MTKDRPALIPFPQQVEWGDGWAELSGQSSAIRVPDGGPAGLMVAAEALARAVHEISGVEPQTVSGKPAPLGLEIVDPPSEAGVTPEFGREGYTLDVTTNGALIRAAQPVGLFYGVQTLRQLMQMADGKLMAPCCSIRDWPAWGWRGVMLDQGRNYQSMEFLKQQIQIMARYKLNVFHFHPTEYPGWRAEIKAFPNLKSELYYTQDEMRELVRFAAERFVTVLPEIEMPGHCTAFLDLMPHLKCTNDTMCMGNEETYSTLETILREVADIFPSPILHIGTDECEGGADCPKCRAKWEEVSKGPNPPASLMMYFIARMNEVVKKLGRRTMMWNDQMDQGLPRDIIIHSWKMDVDAPAIAREGYKTVNSHAQHVYFDHGTAPEYVPRIYNWSPNNDQPMPQPNILGGQGEAWHDPPIEDEDQLLEDLGFYPRLLTLAERVWAGPEGRSVPFGVYEKRLLEHKERYFAGKPFPYPEQTGWRKSYEGWTCERGVYKPPAKD